MIVVVSPVKKEYVPEPSADDTRQAAVHGKVEYMDMPAPSVPLHDVISRNAGRDDSQHK